MASSEDIPEGEREMLKRLPLSSFDITSFVRGKPISQRRLHIVDRCAAKKGRQSLFERGSQLPGHTGRHHPERHHHVPRLG